MVALEWLVGNDVSLLTSNVEHNVHQKRLGLQHTKVSTKHLNEKYGKPRIGPKVTWTKSCFVIQASDFMLLT